MDKAIRYQCRVLGGRDQKEKENNDSKRNITPTFLNSSAYNEGFDKSRSIVAFVLGLVFLVVIVVVKCQKVCFGELLAVIVPSLS
jgi:hypothetical protein